MSESDSLAVVGTIVFIVLGIAAGVWWFWVPCCGLLVLEVLALIPVAGVGGVPVAPQESPDDERLLRSIERAQYSE